MAQKAANNGTAANCSGAVNPAAGQLWQIPVFWAGVLALVGVWFGRPLLHNSDSRQFTHHLAEARQALERSPPQAEHARELSEKLLERAEDFPDQAGEIYFIAGSAESLLAVRDRTEEAFDTWRNARQHLEEAETRGVPESDRGRLKYRLGQAWYHTKADPEKIIAYLSSSVEQSADDPSEGYGMLAQAYLRLHRPNVQAALLANQKQLALPIDNDDVLAPARLLRGELLLRINQPEEARKVLERIGPGVSADVQARARGLLAQICQDQQRWSDAAKLWEDTLADSREAPSEPGVIRYRLGECYRQQGKSDQAAEAWKAALNCGHDENQAAALRLADLSLPGKPDLALEYFDQALKDVTGPEAFHNSLIDLKKTRELFEHGCQVVGQAGNYSAAMKLARLYEKIAISRNFQELITQIADAWAKDGRKKAAALAKSSDATSVEVEARTHFRESAAACEAIARLISEKQEQAEWLWRSADRLIQAQDFAKAAALLEEVIRAETAPERLGETWYALAQVLRAQKNDQGAVAAYRKCIEYPGRFAFRARFQLAQSDIDHGKLDDAEAALKQNLDLMRLTPEDESHERSLFALAGLLFQRAQYRAAARRLQEALERYPASPQTITARLQVAECYRRLAAQENQDFRIGEQLPKDTKLHYWDQSRLWLKMAAENYKKLKADLLNSQATDASESRETILRGAEFAEAECRFELQQYDDAIRLYQQLVDRYKDRADSLVALRQLWRCYCIKKQPEKAKEAVQQARAILNNLKDSAFTEEAGAQTRKDWQQWLDRAEKS